MDFLWKRGFNAIKVMNACPTLVGQSLQLLEAKIQNLTSLGLDAHLVVSGSPEVFKYAIPSFRTKFMLIQSACRAWGFGDGRAKACELVNHYPKLFTNSPHKMRTLIRVASTLLPITAREQLNGQNAYQITTYNQEVVLASALEYQVEKRKPLKQQTPGHPPKMESINNWRRLATGYKSLSKRALAGIIELYPEDRAVKIYRKGQRICVICF